MAEEKDVLILFSGGKDSFLSTLLMIEQGYKVNLVTYENSCGLQAFNVNYGINRLKQKYGENTIKFLGVKNIVAIWRELLYPYYNESLNKILREYGDLPISEFNCLSCRLAMYIASIILCKQSNIKIVVDGARKSQLFAIEQEKMLHAFETFFKSYGITILFPVKDLEEDYELKNEILIRGFVPKTIEPQCLLGIPAKQCHNRDEIIETSKNVFDKLLKNKACSLIEKYSNIKLEGNFF